MSILRSEALLLRSVDFGESDRIVHLLTPGAGRVTAIAKGARRSVKRFPGTLDLFNHLHVQVVHRRKMSMAHLEQATLRCAFLPLRTSAGRFALACYLVEIIDRLAPEGGSRSETGRLFGFTLRALHMLETSAPDARVRVLLELRALDALGLRPELRSCVRCGNEVEGPGPVSFVVADGGVLCRRCGPGEGALPVHLGTLRALEQGMRLDLERLDRLSLPPTSLAESIRLVSRFQRFHLGFEPRSRRFLDEILATPGAGVA